MCPKQHITTPPPRPEQFNPAISPALSEVIMRSLAKKPEERYPSAMALMTAMAVAVGLTLPDRRGIPISSPDIRMLPGFAGPVEDLPTEVPGRPATPIPAAPNPSSPLPAVANPPSPLPETFLAASADEAPTILPEMSPQPAQTVSAAISPIYDQSPQVSQPAPSTYTQAPLRQSEQPPRPASKRRGWVIALSAVLLVVLVGSSVAVFRASRSNPSTSAATTTVGQAFFISTGNGNGAMNLGLNDEFQVNLNNIQAPAAGKQYYAWLLPDAAQPESSDRALGALHLSGGSAMISYTDPQHANLVAQFSRFLVTEEPIKPAPVSPSLDKTTWRYSAEIPQGTFIKDCAGVTMAQLSVLCHLRHLLSGDPDLAKVNLQGGLNYWFLNNVKEMVKWAQEAVDHSSAVDVRHKLVDILYILNGPACIQQTLQHASPVPNPENVVDDTTLPTIAAIPLMSCSFTPNLPGYVAHIDNHLNAMLNSPGVSSNQKTLALQINPELNTIGAWLNEVQTDAMQLVAMDDTQLAQTNAKNLRSAMNTLVTEVLSGGTDANTGTQDQGVQAISLQIQGLAKMDVTAYQSH